MVIEIERSGDNMGKGLVDGQKLGEEGGVLYHFRVDAILFASLNIITRLGLDQTPARFLSAEPAQILTWSAVH